MWWRLTSLLHHAVRKRAYLPRQPLRWVARHRIEAVCDEVQFEEPRCVTADLADVDTMVATEVASRGRQSPVLEWHRSHRVRAISIQKGSWAGSGLRRHLLSDVLTDQLSPLRHSPDGYPYNDARSRNCAWTVLAISPASVDSRRSPSTALASARSSSWRSRDRTRAALTEPGPPQAERRSPCCTSRPGHASDRRGVAHSRELR